MTTLTCADWFIVIRGFAMRWIKIFGICSDICLRFIYRLRVTEFDILEETRLRSASRFFVFRHIQRRREEMILNSKKTLGTRLDSKRFNNLKHLTDRVSEKHL